MKDFILWRYQQTHEFTQGLLFDGEMYLCDTLEKPWLNNKHYVSCVPEGTYPVKKYFSPKRKEFCVLLKNVPDRDFIEIHEATYVADLEGCIGVGTKSLEILLHSREKLAIILELLGNEVGTLTIKSI